MVIDNIKTNQDKMEKLNNDVKAMKELQVE